MSSKCLHLAKSRGRRGGETRSGTQRRRSHNLQSGQPGWWSADSCSIFPTVNQSRTQSLQIFWTAGQRRKDTADIKSESTRKHRPEPDE